MKEAELRKKVREFVTDLCEHANAKSSQSTHLNTADVQQIIKTK